jgi:hypothetical protein
MEFPQFVDFKTKPHVLIHPYEDQGWEDFAVKMMNQILLGCLLTMPKGTVRIKSKYAMIGNTSSGGILAFPIKYGENNIKSI